MDSLRTTAEMMTVILTREPHLSVVGEAVSGTEGLAFFQKYQPSLVISSLDLDDVSGPDMLAEMRASAPAVGILVCTGTKKLDLLYAALELEPLGFVHKSEGLTHFRDAVLLAAQGISYLSPFAVNLVTRRRLNQKSSGRLTFKESNLVRLVAQGLSTKQIAARLNLSPKTVENYRKQVMGKLGLSGIASLTCYALRNGILE